MLSHYLTELAQDPARRNAFFMDPEQEIKAAGLSEDESTALRSRDPQQIRRALSGSYAADTVVIVLIAAAQ